MSGGESGSSGKATLAPSSADEVLEGAKKALLELAVGGLCNVSYTGEGEMGSDDTAGEAVTGGM